MRRKKMERETGFEPATNSLEGCDSTPELLPRQVLKRPQRGRNGGGGRIRTSVGRSPADLQSAAIVHSATPPKSPATRIGGLEPAPGFEPGTYGLQDRSSTPELCRRVVPQEQNPTGSLPIPGAGRV